MSFLTARQWQTKERFPAFRRSSCRGFPFINSLVYDSILVKHLPLRFLIPPTNFTIFAVKKRHSHKVSRYSRVFTHIIDERNHLSRRKSTRLSPSPRLKGCISLIHPGANAFAGVSAGYSPPRLAPYSYSVPTH